MGGGFGQFGSQVPPPPVAVGGALPGNAPKYDPKTGQTTSNAGKPRYDVFGNPVKAPIEPTVLSSSNVQDKYIPDLNTRLKTLETGGTYVGQDGNLYYNSDGSAVAAPLGSEFTGSGWRSPDGKAYKDAPTFSEDPQQNALFQAMKQTLDAQTLASVRSIEQSSQVLKQQQERYNQAYEAGTEQALLLGGSSRYAPISSGGVQLAAQSYGLEKIAALDAQEKELIAKARAAQSSGNFQIMGQALQNAEVIRKEKQAEATKIADARRAELKVLRDKEVQASRDNAIAGLVSQGVTDPSEIILALNEAAQAGGYEFGDFTAKEIDDALKVFTVSGDATKLEGDLGTFEYLKKNGMLPVGITNLDPSQQYFGYLNMQKLAKDGKLSAAAQTYGGGAEPVGNFVGKGAANETEEQIIRTRLFAKLATILNKGTLSDADRAIIEERIAQFRGAGMSEQQIMSALAGFPTDVNTPYNEAFIDLVAVNTETNEQQQVLMAKVGQLLSSGNVEGAMKAVENAALTQAKKLEPDNYLGNATATTYLKNIERIRELLKTHVTPGNTINEFGWRGFQGRNLDKGAPVGPLSGTFQNLLGRIKGKDATAVKAELTNLYSEFRKESAGTATTESELRFLDSLFADIKDTKGNFMEKLATFERQLVQRYNSARSTVNLPELNASQVINPSERLPLYAKDGMGQDDFWNPDSSGSYQIYDPEQGYVLPDTPQSFNSVGGDTKTASRVVGGYDIGSYATDPNHEKRVASIFDKVKTVSNPQQATAYIQSVAPGSPVNGQDVADAAAELNVSIPMLLAIMQQDSTFGTKGKAVRTLNPGNVGNTDSGATQAFPTWRDGVFAVARNLAKRKAS